jgi:hypothetical protein
LDKIVLHDSDIFWKSMVFEGMRFSIYRYDTLTQNWMSFCLPEFFQIFKLPELRRGKGVNDIESYPQHDVRREFIPANAANISLE